MKRMKKVLCLALVLLLAFTSAPLGGFVDFEWGITASALNSTGKCGENVTYLYNNSTRELVISGTGPMTNYDYYDSPFCDSNIKSVVIEDGVTTIGDSAFQYCYSLTSVTIPDSVTTIGDYAFQYCTNLTNVTIGNSVTTIGDYAFYDCCRLTSVTIPDSVNSIGNSAFSDCDSLTSVTIPDSVTTIGDSAFCDCYRLASVTIGDSVTTIGNSAFQYCYNLTSVTMGDSVTSIGEKSFYSCGKLASITIGNSVTDIGNYAFYDCNTLMELVIPDNVKNIGSYAFSGCNRLSIVDIGDGANTINESTFSNCGNLSIVNIGNSVTTIGPSAFLGCKNLVSVNFGENVQNIQPYAFDSCKKLKNIVIPKSINTISTGAFLFCNNLCDVDYAGSEEEWNTINIGSNNNCLINSNKKFNVTHKHTIETINEVKATTESNGKKADVVCSNCDYVLGIGSTVRRISTVKLRYASSYYNGYVQYPSVIVRNTNNTLLKNNVAYTVEFLDGEIKLPGTYRIKITFKGFYAGETILNYTVKPSNINNLQVTGNYITADLTWDDVEGDTLYRVYQYKSGKWRIIARTAENNYKVTGLVPDSYYRFAVKACSADETALGRYSEIYTYTTNEPVCDHIDENGDKICEICLDEAVIHADKYSKLYIDGTLVISGEGNAYAYIDDHRELIKKVVVGEGITSLGTAIFAYCTNLEEVTLPSTLTRIRDEAFYCCESLKKIEIPASVNRFGQSVFAGCTSLENLTIPEGTQDISYYFASGCSALKVVNLPSTVKGIGDGAFAYCTALESIVLPEGLERINGCFEGCSALKSITFPSTLKRIGNNSFAECTGLTEVTVPSNVKYIGYNAFFGCNNLKKAVIDAEEIGDCAFNNSGLSELSLGENVRILGWDAFSECSNLTEVYVPSTVTEIGGNAFALCQSLKEVTIGADYIGEAAFHNCSNLEKATLLDGVTFIGDSAFYECKKLSDINFVDGIEYIEDFAFYNCIGLKSIALPNSLIAIGDYAFYRCHNISSADLGKSVNFIGDYAFADCIRLVIINIPSSVAYIDRGAFADCIRLKEITVNNYACEIESYRNTFPEEAILYGYDDSTLEKYADDWLRTFASLGTAHIHNYTVTTVDATCTENGYTHYDCYCGDSYDTVIFAKGHSKITVSGKNSTCTETGLTDGVICENCKEIFTAQKVIPVKEHSFDDNGKCSICGYTDEPTDTPCDCDCHAGGIKAFFFNFLNFFAKIFDKNARVCECGKAH